jgi:hypothetical protein
VEATREYDPRERRSPLIEMGDDASLNPRRGLRRWAFGAVGALKGELVYVEVREDGSILMAFRLERRLKPDPSYYEVGARDVEGAILDFAVLAQQYARTRTDDAPRAFEVQVVTSDPDTPLRVVDAQRYAGGTSASHDVVPWSTSVWKFEPVGGELPGVTDESSLLSSAETIAKDVLNQFGIDPTFLVT